MAGLDSNKKKITVAGLAFILLVAAVVGAVVVIRKSGGDSRASTGTTSRAVQAICAPTDYKETCEKSLANANTTDPKELIKLALDAAIKNIGDVLKNSALLKEAASDPSIKDAFVVCQEVLETAVEDLQRSVDKVGEFEASKSGEYVVYLKTWLSAVLTNQGTCLDAFENTTGNTGEKMKNMLRTARELSSNGLAMVCDISSLLGSLNVGNVGSSRKLRSEEGRLLYNGDCSDYAPGEDPRMRRRLLQATKMSLKPNIVVAQDGSGQFKTINEAIATLPKKNNQPIVIYVKAGLYKENVIFPKRVNNIMLVGDGPMKTRITGNKNAAAKIKTFDTATVVVASEDFLAKDIAFENTAGPQGHQAVALRVSGDKAIFFNVNIDGYQDSLYAHDYRQYYRDCSISGTIDFVFGDARAVFQNCKFIVRKPGPDQACMLTAQGHDYDPRSIGAFVIQNGSITAEPAFLSAQPPHKAYLGRPWKELSRTIIMQSNIDGFIDPTGWSPWDGNFALDTCYYGEYDNRGAGSSTANRVQWKGIKHITPEIAQSWTGGEVYDSCEGQDAWIKESGVPYVPTLMQVSK